MPASAASLNLSIAVAHLAQHAPQLRFLLPLDRHLGERLHRRGEDQHDRRDDEQFDEREPALHRAVECCLRRFSVVLGTIGP